ncbi:MAG: SusC/RagA family TonB-linked outer membrane protein [Dysgonomonas sp.]
MAFSQGSITVSGSVQDEMGALPGVSVAIKGTTNGTLTDLDGKYTITVSSEKDVLTFSFVGYESQNITVGTSRTINIELKPEASSLDEVVVIGYGTMRKKDLTGASSSIQGTEIKQVPVTTTAQALTGRVAGVNITTQSGAPGSPINVVVRGGTSITQSNAPLYVVDGFQVDDALRKIDASDIESIDVLKDASSTAIYGARGANGVILITTKSGKQGKVQIDYNGYLSFQSLGKKLDVLGPLDFVDLQYERRVLSKGNLSDFEDEYGPYSKIQEEYAHRKGIDWQEEMFGGTALMQNHNVSISGGSEKTRFNVSYTNTSEDGILEKTGYYKNNLRARLMQELHKRVRFNMNINFADTKVMGGGDLAGKLKMTVLQRPTGGIVHTDEELLSLVTDAWADKDSGYELENPIMANKSVTKKRKTRIFDANASLDIDIIKDLVFKAAGSYSWTQVRDDMFDKGLTRDARNKFGGPYGYRNNEENYTWQQTNTLSYKISFDDKNHLDAMLGNEVLFEDKQYIKSGNKRFPDDNLGLNNMEFGEITDPNSSFKAQSTMASFFGRVFYNYDDRYLATFTMRADGSSKFAKGNRWGYFPSASVAWRINQENFMKDLTFFSNLKLRLGYGTSGNNRIEDASFATLYPISKYSIAGAGKPVLIPSNLLGNPELKWETNKSFNIGLDFGIINNRLSGSIDFFRNKTDDLLLLVNLPSMTGYENQFQNIGSTRVQGLEIQLSSTNINTRDFTWTTDFNIAFTKSKVLKLYGTGDDDYILKDDFKVQINKEMGQMYGYLYDGIYTVDDFKQNADGTYTLKDGVAYAKSRKKSDVKPGDIKFKAINGSTDDAGNPVWDGDDRTIIGNGNPDFYGGITNTFKYKGFDLSIFLNFVVGNDILNMSNMRFANTKSYDQNTLSIMAQRFKLIDPLTGAETTNLDRLREINPNARYWNVGPNNRDYQTVNSYYVEDGSFLRINNISLGYTLPKNIVSKLGLQYCRVYGTLNNIHTFTDYSGYDPEVASNNSAITPGVDNSTYPKSKSFVFGLNLTF